MTTIGLDDRKKGGGGPGFAPVPQGGGRQNGLGSAPGEGGEKVPVASRQWDIRSLLAGGAFGGKAAIPPGGALSRPFPAGGSPFPVMPPQGGETAASPPPPDGREEEELSALQGRAVLLGEWRGRFGDYLHGRRAAIQPRDATEVRVPASRLGGLPEKDGAAVLLEELDRAKRDIQTHPLTLRRRKEAAAGMEEEIGGLGNYYGDLYAGEVAKSGNAPRPAFGEPCPQPSSPEMDKVAAARKNFGDALDLLEAPGRYDGSRSGTGNFFRGMGTRAIDRDLWTMGISELSRNLLTSGVASKLEAAGGKDWGEVLTRGEQALLRSWMAKLDAQAERQGDLSAGYEAGRAGADVLEAALETAVFGGLGKAATASARAGLKKWAAGQAADGVLKRGMAKGAAWAGANALRGGVMTALRPATHVNISRRLADFERDGQGRIVLDGEGLPRRKALADAVAEGVAESFIDNFADGTGGAAAAAVRGGGRLAAGRLSGETLRGLKELGGKLAASRPAEMYGRLAALPAYRFLSENVARGWAGEWSDAAFGDLLKAVALDDRTLGDVFSLKEQLTTAASLLPAVFVKGVADKAGVARAGARYREELKGLRKELAAAATPSAEALAGRLETASADDMAGGLAALVGELAGKDVEAARRMARRALGFNGWRSYYHLGRGIFPDRPAGDGVPSGGESVRPSGGGLPGGLAESGKGRPAGGLPDTPGRELPFDDARGHGLTFVRPPEALPDPIVMNDRSINGLSKNVPVRRAAASGAQGRSGDLAERGEGADAGNVMESRADVPARPRVDKSLERSFKREGLGVIDLVWERPGDGSGLASILGGVSPEEAGRLMARIGEVLEGGRVVRHGKRRVSVVKDGARATLRRTSRGNWELAAFEPSPASSSGDARPSPVVPAVVPASGEARRRATVRHFDGRRYSGEVVDVRGNRLILRDGRTGRTIGVPLRNVEEIDGIPPHERIEPFRP